MTRNRRSHAPTSSINITPLIDILLVLLVIFMVISPIDSTGLETALPQDPPIDSKPSDEAIVLSMDETGAIRINHDATDIAGLETQLREIFRTRRDRTIFVQANTELLFNDVARLIDVAKGAGVLKIGLLTSETIFEQAF